MKFKLGLITVILMVCGNLNATQFFALKYEKSGKEFTNEITELKESDGLGLQTIQLSSSYKSRMEKLALPESKNMFFYGMIDRKQAKIQIVDKDDLSHVKTITIDHIHDRLMNQQQLYKFYQLTADHKHLLIHTGFKKNQNLTIIDVDKGSVLRKIPLSRQKNEVSVSADQNYILINNTSRDELTLVSTDDFNVAFTSKLGEFRQFGIIHNNFLYLTKYKGKDRNKIYWIQALNIISKEKLDLQIKSKEQPIFTINERSNELYSVHTDDRGKKLVLSVINEQTISDMGEFDIKMSPEKMFADDQLNKIMIKGKKRISTIDLNNLSQFTSTKLPFDSVNYFYNKAGNLLYLKEGSGSEVAVVDVNSGELLERSGTGRKGVKFGQFMASVALAGVGANFGYMVYFAKYSNTGFTLNHHENKLYVINSKTNDVTHFNAKDLSDRKAIATGGGTFLVHQGDDTDAPLWVFSNKRITQISDRTFTTEKEIDYENIIGFDFDKDYFIIKTTEHIITYDMKTGDISNQWPMFDADIIWSEK